MEAKDYEVFLALRQMATDGKLTVNAQPVKADDLQCSAHWPGINIIVWDKRRDGNVVIPARMEGGAQ
jgi:hypothetical protein